MTQPLRTEARALLALGLPLVGSNIAQFAMHLTDSIMLGWYDVEALAAVTLAGGFYVLLFLFGAGFAWAVMPMVAEAVEGDDTVRARRVTRMGVWLSVAFGLACMVPFWFSGAIFRAIGQAEVVADLGQNYLRIAGWQIVPALTVIVLRSFLSALERTQVILWVTVLTAVLNVPLNWLLIFGGPFGLPALGERGAAISTLAMSSLALVILVIYTTRVAASFNLFQRLWKVDTQAMAQVFALGVPIGLTTLAEAGLFSASSIMMGWLGPVPLAAHGIALQLTSVAFVIHVGLSQAATVRAGRAYGRRDEAALRRTSVALLALGTAFAAVAIVIFIVFPEPMVRIFVAPDDPALDRILSIGVTLLLMAALFHLVDAGQVLVLGLLRGVQDTRVPMWVATVSYWLIGLPASWVFGFVLGWEGVGVWLGLVFGLTCAFVGLSWRFFRQAVKIGLIAPPGADPA